MEKFRQIKKLGVWEKFGENAEDSVSAAAQGGRVDELLAGTDLHLAPKPDFFKTEPPRRPLDPQTLSVEQATVAETLLDGADHLSIADKSIPNNLAGTVHEKIPVDPMELDPNKHLKASEILNNPTEKNSVLVPKKQLTEISTEKPLQQATFGTSPFTNDDTNVYNRIGKNSLTSTPPRAVTAAKPKGFLRKIFGG